MNLRTVAILLLALIVATALGAMVATRRTIPRRSLPGGGSESSFVITAVRTGGWIALVRVGLYGAALVLYRQEDWRQAAGYALLILNSPVELWIVRAVTDNRTEFALGAVAVAGVIVLTSMVLGAAWAAIRR